MPKKTLRPLGGHILDIDSSEIGEQFLSTARNVNTRKGFPSRRKGRRVIYPVVSGHAPNHPLHLLNLQLNTFNWWMLPGLTNIFAVEGSNSYDISLPGQSPVTDTFEWSSTLLNGLPVFSNGKNVLFSWAGSGGAPCFAIPGFPVGTSVKSVIAFRFHLFGLNVDGPGGTFTNQIIWSDAAAPGALPATWTPGVGNEAGSAILADTQGRCIVGRPLGAQLWIYKPQSTYPLQYSGQQPDRIFTVGQANRSLGTIGPHCVIDYGDKHLVVGNDDICLFDGINARSIAVNRIKNYLANSIDEAYAQNSFVVRDFNRRETWVCVPETGSRFATVAHIWDEARDTWSTVDLNAVRYGTTGYVTDTAVSSVWDAQAMPWDSVSKAWNASSDSSVAHVVLTEDETMYLEDTNDSVSVTALIAKNDLSFDDDSQQKIIQNVTVRGTGLGFANLEFRLGARDSTEASVTWQAWQPLRSDGQLTIPEICGRYISIEIRATSTEIWTINKIIIGYKYNGAY